MKITLSVIKADIGSIGGHIEPGRQLMDAVRKSIAQNGEGTIIGHNVTHCGDDIAILMTHTKGEENEAVHKLAYDAFMDGTKLARQQGLYAAGQDLLKDTFSGNVKGMGPAVAEMEFEERPGEPFCVFTADKTDPGAYNLPLYLMFADPMTNPGLMLSPAMRKGFRFTIMDVEHTEGDRVIELNAPEDIYDIAALLRDNQRYVVETVHNRAEDEIAATVSTTRLHNIAGTYTGKDDPVMLVRAQSQFPSTGEILAPFQIGHYVAGFMRGSHNGPLMPVAMNSGVAFFDGPPVVNCAAYSVHEGRLTEPSDPFAHPFWDQVRARITDKAIELRKQGFSGPAMLPMAELEYGGIKERLNRLNDHFKVRS